MRQDIFLTGQFHRLAPPGDIRGVSCDENGPAIGPIRLLVKTGGRFAPRPVEEMNRILSVAIGRTIDCSGLVERLQSVTLAMNEGELARAIFATQYLHLPALTDEEAQRAQSAEALLKAAPDDPKHPGWPKGTEGGKGGKFRPKDNAEDAAGKTADRLLSRVRRREIRTALLHVMGRRAGRLILEAAGDAIPGVDAIAGLATAADVAAMTAEFAALQRETDAALKFVGNGPYSLEQLRASDNNESFSSFDEFKKINLAKRFGPAGDGYEYHHIVEQSSSDSLSEEQLQSTANIVRIPKLLHEEITSSFSKVDENSGISLRQALKGKPFEVRWDEGISVMRRMGIIGKED